MKTVCRYFYYFGKIENSQLHSDQPNIFNKILRGSEEKWKKQWSGLTQGWCMLARKVKRA